MKKLTILLGLIFLSASCGFGGSSALGVVKTINGGVDWQFFNEVGGENKGNINTTQISKMSFDPQNSAKVFIGSYNHGLFVSENSGESWRQILSKVSVYDFATDPFDSEIIYAGGIFGDFGKLLKTEDGGGSWQEVYNESSSQNAVRAIAVNPGNPNQVVIGTTSGNLIVSSDSGLSWQLLENFKDRINRVSWQEGKLYVLLKSKGLNVSLDGGQNFENLTKNLSEKFRISGGVSINSERVSRFNRFFVDSVSDSLIYLATSKGVYKSIDAGVSWEKMNLPVKETNTDVWSISVAKTSSNLVFASVGSTIYKSVDSGVSWQTQSITTNGFVNDIIIDPNLPQIVYAGLFASQ